MGPHVRVVGSGAGFTHFLVYPPYFDFNTATPLQAGRVGQNFLCIGERIQDFNSGR